MTTSKKPKQVVLQVYGWAVTNYSGNTLLNVGIGRGIYTIYSKRPKKWGGLVPVTIRWKETRRKR